MARPAFAKNLRLIQKKMRAILDDEIKEFGISEGQLEYLITIYENEKINQVEIAKQLDVGKASVTKAVKILEKSGFITKSRDPLDNRSYILELTESGKKVGARSAEKFDRVQTAIFAEYSMEELEELTNLLERLRIRISDLSGKN